MFGSRLENAEAGAACSCSWEYRKRIPDITRAYVCGQFLQIDKYLLNGVLQKMTSLRSMELAILYFKKKKKGIWVKLNV